MSRVCGECFNGSKLLSFLTIELSRLSEVYCPGEIYRYGLDDLSNKKSRYNCGPDISEMVDPIGRLHVSKRDSAFRQAVLVHRVFTYHVTILRPHMDLPATRK